MVPQKAPSQVAAWLRWVFGKVSGGGVGRKRAVNKQRRVGWERMTTEEEKNNLGGEGADSFFLCKFVWLKVICLNDLNT